MEESAYGLSITLPVSFETAVEEISGALKAEGFGVLTSIDVQQTLKAKLNRDFRKYVILGACKPGAGRPRPACRTRDRPAVALQRHRV